MSHGLSASAFSDFLIKLNACPDASAWAEGKDFSTAWATCHRGDWMLLLLEIIDTLDDKSNEVLVCRFAREVVHMNPDPRVLACIEVREAWALGKATGAQRTAARAASVLAAKTAYRFGFDGTARAGWAAANLSPRDAARTSLWASVWVAEDAALVAGDNVEYAWAASLAATLARQSDIIREVVPMPFIA